MVHLEKISISNARRFGKNVEIDFGKGSTILLAPNGTGKTTVFEAIELALTGRLEKLGHSQNALIRDNEKELDVRLDFSNDLFCEVAFRLRKDPVLKGNHSELFDKNIADVPYLLRLTHLLEQRATDWFVDSDENEAGNLIDKLSIGQDLNRIISKKSSVLKSFTKEYNRIDEKLEESKEVLSEFKKKLDERSNTKIDIELVPLSEIFNLIEKYYRKVDNDGEIKRKDNVSSNIAFVKQTKLAIDQKINDNSKKSSLFTELEGTLGLFNKNKELISNKEKEYNHRLSLIKQNEVELNEIEKTKQEIEIELNKQQKQIKSLIELKDFFHQLILKKEEKEKMNETLNSLNKEFKNLNKELKSTNEKIENDNKLIDRYRIINEELIKIQSEKINIENLENLQKKWAEEFVKIKKLKELTIPELSNQKLVLEDSLIKINEELSASKLDHKKKRESFKLLKQTSDSIQEAVSVIATNINKNRRDCPLCGADYEPHDLHDRIKNSLNKINPAISDAVKEEKLAFKKLEEVMTKYRNEEENLKKLKQDLEYKMNQLNELIILVEESIMPNFLDCKTENDAQNYIEEKKKTLTVRIENINKIKKEIKPEPNFESTNADKLQKNKLEREVETLQIRLIKVNKILNNLEADIRDIEAKVGDSSSEKVNEDILKNEELIENLKYNIQQNEQNEKKLIAQNKKLKEENLEENELINKLKNQVSVIIKKWFDANLGNVPSLDKLEEANIQLLKENKELNDAMEKLLKLDQELSRWQSAEKFEILDKEIKKIISPLNEQQYIEKLENVVKDNEILLANFNEKHDTIKDFFQNAINELSKVHTYIESINPFWSGLLKRIVINPRFSDADLLKSGTYRNQHLASTEATLHNELYKVSYIASEAQLTDLQLTFLLTMAQSYEWTPWKALLLDDPTQHHDLVHASSVFDLLRDYIADLNFQVMLSTHDSVQAKFFQRKLHNDGIDAKIYKLKSKEGGVIAECLD